MIQKEGNDLIDPVHLFDEGSTVSWIPCGRKLTCSFPGIKFHYGPDEWCDVLRFRLFTRSCKSRALSQASAWERDVQYGA
jgi:hypothetical protein